jgi:ADP-dependent phosphofructokinase/glucokinase
MIFEEFKELLDRFEEVNCQSTVDDVDISLIHSRAYNYYMTHKGATSFVENFGKALAFANFVAGYLKAKIDAKRGNLL